MPGLRAPTLLIALSLALVLAGCGDDDDSVSGSQSPTSIVAGSPTASPDPLVPPLEGPPREPYIGDPQDFRTNPDYVLPEPGGVPTPADSSDPILSPPAEPDCPEDWEELYRGPEGFKLCYPPDWTVLTDAYKNAPNEHRWYAGGVYKFPGDPPEHQLAHVSVYAIPQFTRPFPYTRDCPTPYSVQLGGEPSVVCPSFPASHPEARIVSYHVFREGFDYFFNIALYYRWDDGDEKYKDQTDEEAFADALRIIHSVEFFDVPESVLTPTATSTQ